MVWTCLGLDLVILQRCVLVMYNLKIIQLYIIYAVMFMVGHPLHRHTGGPGVGRHHFMGKEPWEIT